MPRLVDDPQLRQAFRAGDKQALTTVYREYARPLHALLRRGFTFSSDGRTVTFAGFGLADSENAMQEVFARAFAEAARNAYDGLRPYRNYLFAIARNYVADEFRKKRGRVFVAVEDAEPAHEDTTDMPLDHRDLQTQVEAFIAELETHERGVFAARFERGTSITLAAQELGMSEHHIKVTERTIRKRFFQRMRRLGYFEGYRFTGEGLEKLSPVVLALLYGVPR